MNKRHIFLIGYMGSGKTSVGQVLSGLTGLDLIDMDEEIERAEGSSIRNIFIKYGEHEFRNKESELLDKLCQVKSAIDIITGEENSGQKILDKESKYQSFCSIPAAIISCGGGVILDDLNRSLLKDQSVIFLNGDPALLFERIKEDKNRPLAYMENVDQSQRLSKFMDLYEKRKGLYEEVATYTVDIDGKSPEEVGKEILALLN